jgi:uroporphyrinogen-III synthase
LRSRRSGGSGNRPETWPGDHQAVATEPGPLAGFVIGITADRRWEQQAELLQRRGATVVHGPTITTTYLDGDAALRRASEALVERPPAGLVANTGIGVRAWWEALQSWGLADAMLAALRDTFVVARGPKAAGAAQAAGLEVHARARTERLDEVVELLAARGLSSARVAVQLQGDDTREAVARLRLTGADVVEVPVYRWHLPDDLAPARRLVDEVCDGRIDAVTFTSAPAVRNLFAIAERDGRSADLLGAFDRGVLAACVGPVCAQAARQLGVDAPVEPAVGRLGLLVRAVGDNLSTRRREVDLDGLAVLVQGGLVTSDGVTVELTPRERSLLAVLVERPGVVVPRALLLRRVWGAQADPHVLDTTVARLRRRLAPLGMAIASVRARGYRLTRT